MPACSFVLCAEGNHTEEQARLLVSSLRRHGGRCSGADVYVVAPREQHALSDAAADGLTRSLGATVVRAPLNTLHVDRPQANKIYACLWAEEHARTSHVAFLDTDSVILDEPGALHEPSQDCYARPVWLAGIGSTGPDDPADRLWQAAARACGAGLGPARVVTRLCRKDIRRYCNTGLLAYRRSLGVARAWLDCYRSLGRDAEVLRLLRAAADVEFPAGATPEFFLDQLAFALALDRLGILDVDEMDRGYNVPVDSVDRAVEALAGGGIVHLHYLKYFNDPAFVRRLAAALGPDPGKRGWLLDHLPLEPPHETLAGAQFRAGFETAMQRWRERLVDGRP